MSPFGITAGLREIEREMERDKNLQRIADAAEKIADNLGALVSQVDEIRAALTPKAGEKP